MLTTKIERILATRLKDWSFHEGKCLPSSLSDSTQAQSPFAMKVNVINLLIATVLPEIFSKADVSDERYSLGLFSIGNYKDR